MANVSSSTQTLSTTQDLSPQAILKQQAPAKGINLQDSVANKNGAIAEGNISEGNLSAPATPWLQKADHPVVKAQLVLTGQLDKKTKQVGAYFDVVLDGDWKTYWRTPGEGGVAPAVSWEGSENIKDIDWKWPAPKRYEQLGIEVLGYKHHVRFPIEFTLDDLGKQALLKGTFTLSSCTNVCVLTQLPFSLSFNPYMLSTSEENMHLWSQAMSQVPQDDPSIDVDYVTWNKKENQLIVKAHRDQSQAQVKWQTPDVLVDGKDGLENIFFLKPKIEVSGNEITAYVPVKSWQEDIDLTGKIAQITILDKTTITEKSKQIDNNLAQLSNGQAQSQDSWLKVALFALIGGFILNLMPCVLPVLGLKLTSVIAAKGKEQARIRVEFLAVTFGIIVAFLGLAAVLIGLKLAGHTIGWGIQFQNPYFLGCMVLITLLFATNLLGLWEIRLPSNLNTYLASKGGEGLSGHFVQGLFATLLATPCSAPFLATAVSVALQGSAMTTLLLFVMLGIGMALPWILIAAFPSLVRFLPKPGAWMHTMRLIFGFMLFATSLWLFTLLANFIDLIWLVSIAAVILIIILAQVYKAKGKAALIKSAAAILICISLAFAIAALTADKWKTQPKDELTWHAFEPNKIPALIDQGKTVFVDVTADWCITCKANKIGVISQDPTYSRMQADDVYLMRADWTKPSDKVSSYMQSFGRFGVPLNVVYGVDAMKGNPLPVVLTHDIVKQAFEGANPKVKGK